MEARRKEKTRELRFIKYYDIFKPKRESDVIDYQHEILVAMKSATKETLNNKFTNRKNGSMSYRQLWYGIVSCILHGDSHIKTVDELLEYLLYSKYTHNNNIENKWRNKYENKIYNTVGERRGNTHNSISPIKGR
tara:strand:- start:671 stop:1075 length:405 start_codon:yes stop_codon:yes gene_type:complete